ncbi:MAG: tRNA (N(6)-L-threonylcarbamoyladenosine(37)-C(2))-methylthiotransferase [ANME-2 cluster archaeon]|nr:MAG: tRNA (N(6)-L-threonylcarbamoyladenosine(37)-C(2))-methylthiotransferase [ANME-2 cluster archaeon]
MKIFIKTFGCTANRADSIKIQQILSAQGHIFTDVIDSAELVVVNTCTVTQTTQRKVLKFIHSVSDSGKQIVAAGCLPAAQPEALADIKCQFVTPASIEDIPGIVGNSTINKESYAPILHGVTGIISISQGCAGNCSYCIVKQARGELVSRPISDIVIEMASLVQQGAKEIQLTSQDTAAYGLDTGHRLPALLEAVTGIEGDYMVRLGMMNPFTVLDIVDNVVESFHNPHIFKFLHLPIQSGSDQVLEHMNRRHTVGDFKYIVNKFRIRFPDIVLSTDFIVGYPTETEQDFNDTLELLNEVKPLKVNITKYSPRPKTPASLLYDMPDWKKKERTRTLSIRHHQINQKLLQNNIGKTVTLLTTEIGKNKSTIGRDLQYHNIVIKEDLPLGNWYEVEITESKTTYLIGKQI